MKPYPATFDETTFGELIAHRRQSAEPRDWRVSRAEQEDLMPGVENPNLRQILLGTAIYLVVVAGVVALAAYLIQR